MTLLLQQTAPEFIAPAVMPDDTIKDEFSLGDSDGKYRILIDRSGTVRHLSVNDMDTGRNIDEILRTLDAVRRFDETGEFCPANWDVDRHATGGRELKGVSKNVQTLDL